MAAETAAVAAEVAPASLVLASVLGCLVSLAAVAALRCRKGEEEGEYMAMGQEA